MLIYFVRHGRTDHNRRDRFQTALTPLSPEGMMQATLLAKRLRQSSIKRIYTSSMFRAIQTATIIADELSLPVLMAPVLEEAKRPSAVRGKRKSDPSVMAIMEQVKAHFGDPNWAHSDEENYTQLQARARNAIQLLLDSPDQEILVVTHGEILRMILSIMVFGSSITPAIFEKMTGAFATSNAGLTVVTNDSRGWYVRTWNEESYLPNVKYEYGQAQPPQVPNRDSQHLWH